MTNLTILLPTAKRPPSPDIGATVRCGNRRGVVVDVIPFAPCYCVAFADGEVWLYEDEFEFVKGRAA